MSAKFRVVKGELVGPQGLVARCAIGRGGLAAASDKREGDLKTPIGTWPLRRVLYRADRVSAPRTALPCAALRDSDGWCDAPQDPNYNRQISLPYPASAERLWRDDHVYDIVVVLGHNDEPTVSGAGSAIFLHLAQPDWRGTEGCVAVTEENMRALLASAAPGDALEIVG